MSETIHLRPHAEVAERVLLPGDPGRALRLAQILVESPPRMLNHNRGLWGYTGTAPDGEPLTIQSTGMGGPSAAIVAEELIALGARRLVRVGTCGALTDSLGLGDLLVATSVLSRDGTSSALGAPPEMPVDADLLASLDSAGPGAHRGSVVSSDLFYDSDRRRADEWVASGAVAVEMEAAAVLAVAAVHGVAAACVLVVSDTLTGGRRRRIEADDLLAAERELGRVGAAAVGGAPGQAS